MLFYENFKGVRFRPERYPEKIVFPGIQSEDDVTTDMIIARINDVIKKNGLEFIGGISIKWYSMDEQGSNMPSN